MSINRPSRGHIKEVATVDPKKTLKLVIIFIIIGIIAFIITVVSVTVSFYFGNQIEIFPGIYFNTSLFITTIIGLVVTPIIIVYVNRQMSEAKEIVKKK